MDEAFDPYRKWLGIPAQDQPPNHYRLLGVELFESDSDVIATAADGRMALVKSFEKGRYSDLSQRILNELSAARVQLLDPRRRVEYDRQLRAELAAREKPRGKASPAARKPPLAPGTSAINSLAAPVLPLVPSGRHSPAGRRSRRRLWWIAAPTAVGLAVTIVLVIYLSGHGESSLAQRSTASHEQGEPHSTSPARFAAAEASAAASPMEETSKPRSHEQPSKPEGTCQLEPAPSQAEPSRLLDEVLDPMGAEEPADADAAPFGSDAPPAGTQAAAKKQPLPDAAAQREAEQRIRSIFSREFTSAKTPEEKMKLSGKLAAQAAEATVKATERYMLLRMAQDLAAAAGQWAAALELVDRIGQGYDLDLPRARLEVLEDALKSIRPGSQAGAECREIADAAAQSSEAALEEDDFDGSNRLLKLAMAAARRAKDPQLPGELTRREREIERLKRRFGEVKAAAEVLAKDANDATANSTVGRWECFNKGHWAKGLPLLAKGTDAELAALARSDLATPSELKQQVALADKWWDWAAKEPTSSRAQIQMRAGHWYEQALPKLSGLDKTAVEKRLQVLAPPPGAGVVQKGNVALATNGTKVTGNIKSPEQLIDGNAERFGPSSGFAWANWPCEWTITFNKPYSLREIRFRLFDGNPASFYRYTLATSRDGQQFEPLADRSQGGWSSWQVLKFAPRPVKAVKLVGLYHSVNDQFHVIEFEAYCFPPSQPPVKTPMTR